MKTSVCVFFLSLGLVYDCSEIMCQCLLYIYELPVPVHFMCNCIPQPGSIRNYIYDFPFFDSLVKLSN